MGAIRDLLETGAIEEVKDRPYVCNPLSVSINKAVVAKWRGEGSGIFHTGIWAEFDKVEDPTLLQLAKYLPSFSMASRADSTTLAYSNAFSKWSRFASDHNLTAIPAEPSHVSLYLTHLIQGSLTAGSTKQTVESAFYSIQWAHQIAGLPSPTEHPFVKNLVESARRLLGRPVIKKQPVTTEVISELVEHFKDSSSLKDVRDICLMLIAFAGFLRFSDVVNIKRSHVSFFDSHVSIVIQKSKNDQYSKGNVIHISRSGKTTCPVAYLERYLTLAGISSESHQFIFRPLFVSKHSVSLIHKDKHLSYTRVRELVKQKLSLVVDDVSVFGTHSFRSGGATTAAQAGISSRQLMQHGRWRSSTAKDGYIHDTISECLSVTKCLGV
ncbi:integrase/recombinase xerD homolog [Glandiceps talaboti]